MKLRGREDADQIITKDYLDEIDKFGSAC